MPNRPTPSRIGSHGIRTNGASAWCATRTGFNIGFLYHQAMADKFEGPSFRGLVGSNPKLHEVDEVRVHFRGRFFPCGTARRRGFPKSEQPLDIERGSWPTCGLLRGCVCDDAECG